MKKINQYITEQFGNTKIRTNNLDSKKIALKLKNFIKKERGKMPRVYVQIV